MGKKYFSFFMFKIVYNSLPKYREKVGVYMFDPTREHDINLTRVFAG